MASSRLSGLKVLDLTRVLAGPLCTMTLADLGADVIKVERPGRGDDTRQWGPPFDAVGQSAYFLSINRNKFSVAADLRLARDRAMILDLAKNADVVVENFLPGALEKLGIDVDATLRDSASLIWCTITGFGEHSQRPGYDFVVQAECGWMSITGEPNGEPMKSGVALADIIAGKDAAIAILAALAGGRKERDTSARRIVISLARSARAALVNTAQNALVSGGDAGRWGNTHANLVPYELFEASDRSLVVAVGNDEQWLACVRVLGLTDLENDMELRSNRGRLAHRDRVVAAIQRMLAQRTATEWMRLLDAVRVPCGVVKTVREAIADEPMASPMTGMPPAVPGTVRYPPPKLDQHGDLVRRLGWGAFRVTA